MLLDQLPTDSVRAAADADRLSGNDGQSAHSAARRRSLPIGQPLRVMFMHTDLRIGGAEMVTSNLIRRLDRARFAPELCCLKERGALGESLAGEFPVHHGFLRNKFDLRVWPGLVRLLRHRAIDVVLTVGAGDKMFWGRLAAQRARVPVILSALHSTGWPDGVGRLNRLLTPITDAFIAVASSHGRFLVEHEQFPADKVAVIPNGVDTEQFAPIEDGTALRRQLGIESTAPVIGIVAALRPEKDHELFLEMAGRIVSQIRSARFLIVGDGPRRPALEQRARKLGIKSKVTFLGNRADVPRLLAAFDVFVLTSQIEANPISILEAMSAGKAVVATDVGSIREVVAQGTTGFLVPPGDVEQMAERVLQLIRNPRLARTLGTAGRSTVVDHWSIDAMTERYEGLIESIYARKRDVPSGYKSKL
jgi:glycosyltransferase involved in cell wall biosynthesis